MKTTETSVFTV